MPDEGWVLMTFIQWRYIKLSEGAYMVEQDSGNGYHNFAIAFNQWDADLLVRSMVNMQRDIP